jgi:hypothetical protein
MSKILAQSIDEGALMEACYETASRTMFDSEPEGSKIREVADKFLKSPNSTTGPCPRLATTRSSFGQCATWLMSMRSFY